MLWDTNEDAWRIVLRHHQFATQYPHLLERVWQTYLLTLHERAATNNDRDPRRPRWDQENARRIKAARAKRQRARPSTLTPIDTDDLVRRTNRSLSCNRSVHGTSSNQRNTTTTKERGNEQRGGSGNYQHRQERRADSRQRDRNYSADSRPPGSADSRPPSSVDSRLSGRVDNRKLNSADSRQPTSRTVSNAPPRQQPRLLNNYDSHNIRRWIQDVRETLASGSSSNARWHDWIEPVTVPGILLLTQAWLLQHPEQTIIDDNIISDSDIKKLPNDQAVQLLDRVFLHQTQYVPPPESLLVRELRSVDEWGHLNARDYNHFHTTVGRTTAIIHRHDSAGRLPATEVQNGINAILATMRNNNVPFPMQIANNVDTGAEYRTIQEFLIEVTAEFKRLVAGVEASDRLTADPNDTRKRRYTDDHDSNDGKGPNDRATKRPYATNVVRTSHTPKQPGDGYGKSCFGCGLRSPDGTPLYRDRHWPCAGHPDRNLTGNWIGSRSHRRMCDYLRSQGEPYNEATVHLCFAHRIPDNDLTIENNGVPRSANFNAAEEAEIRKAQEAIFRRGNTDITNSNNDNTSTFNLDDCLSDITPSDLMVSQVNCHINTTAQTVHRTSDPMFHFSNAEAQCLGKRKYTYHFHIGTLLATLSTYDTIPWLHFYRNETILIENPRLLPFHLRNFSEQSTHDNNDNLTRIFLLSTNN